MLGRAPYVRLKRRVQEEVGYRALVPCLVAVGRNHRQQTKITKTSEPIDEIREMRQRLRPALPWRPDLSYFGNVSNATQNVTEVSSRNVCHPIWRNDEAATSKLIIRAEKSRREKASDLRALWLADMASKYHTREEASEREDFLVGSSRHPDYYYRDPVQRMRDWWAANPIKRKVYLHFTAPNFRNYYLHFFLELISLMNKIPELRDYVAVACARPGAGHFLPLPSRP